MKKILFIIGCLIGSINFANAVIVQSVRLKNGTILNGYIQHQDKNENITFRSENAVVCVDGKNATTTEHVYKINELDKKWVEWAEANDAFSGTGDGRTLTLNEIVFSNTSTNSSVIQDSTVAESRFFENDFKIRHSTVVKVRVLEKGLVIKYLELTPNTYSFNWEDVENILSEKRGKTALSGIDRIYQLKNGQEVRGQYAGESYNSLSLYTGNGMKETFDIDNVIKYTYKGINPNQNIFEQSELVDVVRTKSQGTFRGVIVERNFTEGNNYLVIQQQSGSSQMLKFADIADYSKEENPDFNPKFDILLKQGEVVINRVPTDSVGVKKDGSTLVLDSINHKVVVPKTGDSTKIIVEFNNPQHRSIDHLLLVKVDKSVSKRNVIYSFSTDIYEMKKFTAQSTETSVNNTTKVEYTITGQGVFALYDQETKQAMPFIVK